MSDTSENSVIGSEDPDSTNTKILRAIADVFQSAQSTYAGHRRHIAVLKRIQAKAAEQGYEEVFNYWFNKMVTLVLPLKRTEVVGDRIVRLVAGFVSSIEHGLEPQDTKQPEHNGNEEIFSRFVNQFIRHILRGVESRDKNVRYRVAQFLAVIMDNIGEIDEDLYNLIMWSFQKRVYDKEPFVRIQSIFCLTKFQDEENTSETEDEATKNLMLAIQNDPSAEVRRAAMLNLISTKKTKDIIMERARDVNPINRRIVYTRVLKNMGAAVFRELDGVTIGNLITWGLEDREEAVRNACARLVAFEWLNLMEGDIIKLLTELNVTSNKVCEKVMEAIFSYRDDTIAKIKLPDDIWDNLTAEISFLIKAFHFHCTQQKLEDVIDANFPEASKLSEILQKYFDIRFTHSNLSETDVICLEFVLEQLLSVAFRFDYSDEIGRRAMLIVIRNALANYKLAPTLVRIALKVLEVLSINERDFITMTVEIITDIRDEDIERQEAEEADKKSPSDENEDQQDEEVLDSFHSAVDGLINGNITPEKYLKEDVPDKEAGSQALLACLSMSQYMLELVVSPIEDNIMISSLIETLITPAVRNTQSDVRELGVRNLGLCCLLDVNLATESLYLFGMCVSKGDANLKTTALKVIVDIFSVHGTKVVDGEGKVDSISLHKIFYKTLKNCEQPECQATVAEGLCKLFLGDVFTDDDLFETLVLSYFSPANSQNEALVQAFAFCLPVYCFSHVRHQKRMVRVAGDVLLRLSVLWDELQSSDDSSMPHNSMLKPSVIFQALIEWTDSNKVVNQVAEISDGEDTQLDFLLNVLKMYYRFERKEVKKMILININKFSFNDDNRKKWKEARETLEDILDNDDIDAACRNSVNKFLNSINEFVVSKQDIEEDLTKNEEGEDEESILTPAGREGDEILDNNEADGGQSSIADESKAPQQPDNSLTGANISEISDAPSAHATLPDGPELPRTRKRKRIEAVENGYTSDQEKSSRMVSFVLPEDNDEREYESSVDSENNDGDYNANDEDD
ncbi:LANO_0B05622g1_1 [Lachancea nothofagi CBS 11611]|uniref:LANO_0B05622g1_1 n=1 Tax=Lachancea nothofagi CBS 11611 TaxID=1266666 RepID=A0A1G4IYG9_9SACH|nr:LANO_0B05622g1_1 [Lachancea nothofagi CBS 11611]